MVYNGPHRRPEVKNCVIRVNVSTKIVIIIILLLLNIYQVHIFDLP